MELVRTWKVCVNDRLSVSDRRYTGHNSKQSIGEHTEAQNGALMQKALKDTC